MTRNFKNYVLTALTVVTAVSGVFAAGDTSTLVSRWKITAPARITWAPGADVPHKDHLEMSGKRISVVLRYGVTSSGEFTLNKSFVWPLLRTIPNNTHASLMRQSGFHLRDVMTVNGKTPSNGVTEQIVHRGVMEVREKYDMGRTGSFLLESLFYPSAEAPAFFERYTFINTGKNNLNIELPESALVTRTPAEKGVDGSYRLETTFSKNGSFTIAPGERLRVDVSTTGYKSNEQAAQYDYDRELNAREELVEELTDNLVLETPSAAINTMFAFSKIRACESIFQTKGGPMHGPGGESYYAAIWANDQAEYINPYFPFTGYGYGNESALNSYLHFARFMNNEMKPIPSSIIAEGIDIWNGAGDRGDAAMIAYGAVRYALARGDKDEALRLWPLITWCLDYCKLKLNQDGVVASDSDELEGRFPAGDANLCTSSLYYDALISSAYLAGELGKGKQVAATYRKQAATLAAAIESYFGETVEGYETYAYYKGNDVLRSWICIPLTVGIHQRSRGTVEALFSDRLWTKDGLLTQAGSTTFWDRSTLYALRGAYQAGERERATDFLIRYSQTRLLGDHVPYAIEAWPEGDQRHLSAESALYGRVITEGLFGIRPTGFRSFELTCNLPQGWDTMALRKIRAFGADFDVEVSRMGERMQVKVVSSGKVVLEKSVPVGETLSCKL